MGAVMDLAWLEDGPLDGHEHTLNDGAVPVLIFPYVDGDTGLLGDHYYERWCYHDDASVWLYQFQLSVVHEPAPHPGDAFDRLLQRELDKAMEAMRRDLERPSPLLKDLEPGEKVEWKVKAGKPPAKKPAAARKAAKKAKRPPKLRADLDPRHPKKTPVPQKPHPFGRIEHDDVG